MKAILRSRNIGLVIGLAIMLALAYVITPQFYDGATLVGMLQNNCIYLFLAVAEIIVIISGAIDLSGPSILALTGCLSAVIQMENPDMPAAVLILLSIAIGLACGLFNGLIVNYLRINPMIATLGTSYIIRGIAFLVSDGEWVMPHQFTENFTNLSVGKIFGVYNIIWFAAAVIIAAGIFLGYTTLGRRQYAVGSNAASAAVAGIKVKKTGVQAYMIGGAVCGLAGILYAANFAACNYQVATGYEMTAIAICILGGAGVTGGTGKISGLFLAVLMISVINSFISMLPGLSIWADAIQGFIIIAAVLINVFMARTERQRELKRRESLI